MPDNCRPFASWCPAKPVQGTAHKPANWWAIEREPWKRVSIEVAAQEKAALADAPPLVPKDGD